MLKIKIFDESHEKDLEQELNNFIEQITKEDKEVIDIKYQVSCAASGNDEIFCFSALVMYDDKVYQEYKPKVYELVEKVEQ